MIPKIFTCLPDEILNKIFLMYWETVFSNVITELNNIKNYCNYINNFTNKYKFNNITIQNYTNMTKYNDLLKNITSNKGSKLFSTKINHFFNYVKNENITFIDSNIGLIFQYLCSKSGYMRYYVLNDYMKFKQLVSP